MSQLNGGTHGNYVHEEYVRGLCPWYNQKCLAAAQKIAEL